MLVSLIGLLIILVVGIVVGARWLEKSLWSGVWTSWRHALWGISTTEKADILDEYDKKKLLSDRFEVLQVDYNKRNEEYYGLYHRIYDCDGLEAQVADLKQVLEWTRTSLNDAKQECLEQMGWAHEVREELKLSKDLERVQRGSLRTRAKLIRDLEEHVAERDSVIENLRGLLLAKKRAKRAVAKKKKSGLESRRFTVIGNP